MALPRPVYTNITIPLGDSDSYTWKMAWRTNPSPDDFYGYLHGYIRTPSGGQEVRVGMRTIGEGVGGKCLEFEIAGALEGVSDGIVESGFDAVDGITTRVAFNWAVDRTYTLALDKGETAVDGQWWDAVLIDRDSFGDFVEVPIASIRVALEWFGLYDPVWFTRRFPLETSACSDVRYCKIDYTELRADGVLASAYDGVVGSGTCDSSRVTPL